MSYTRTPNSSRKKWTYSRYSRLVYNLMGSRAAYRKTYLRNTFSINPSYFRYQRPSILEPIYQQSLRYTSYHNSTPQHMTRELPPCNRMQYRELLNSEAKDEKDSLVARQLLLNIESYSMQGLRENIRL